MFSTRYTVSAEESQHFQDMEDTIWSVLGNIAGGAISDTDAITDVVSEIVRNNNLDNADAGTYTFFYKKIRYKKHLGNGNVYVELRQKIVRIDFSSTEKSTSREIIFTLR